MILFFDYSKKLEKQFVKFTQFLITKNNLSQIRN